MAVRINRDALHKLIDAECDSIEATPVPPEMAGLGSGEGFSADEVLALWFGAGIASQIGMRLTLDPSPFVDGWPTDADGEPVTKSAPAE